MNVLAKTSTTSAIKKKKKLPECEACSILRLMNNRAHKIAIPSMQWQEPALWKQVRSSMLSCKKWIYIARDAWVCIILKVYIAEDAFRLKHSQQTNLLFFDSSRKRRELTPSRTLSTLWYFVFFFSIPRWTISSLNSLRNLFHAFPSWIEKKICLNIFTTFICFEEKA